MGVPLVLIHFIDWIFHESIQLYPNDEKEPPILQQLLSCAECDPIWQKILEELVFSDFW